MATRTINAAPNVVIKTNEAGTIVVGGTAGCGLISPADGNVKNGENNITLKTNGDKEYRCTIIFTDAAGNQPRPLTLTEFILDRSCLVTSPSNGTMGNCPSILAHHTDCQLTCNPGYSLNPQGASASCDSGTLTAPRCITNPCTPTAVSNSDYAAKDSLNGSTGETISVKCRAGFAGSGSVSCQTSGVFSDLGCTACPARYCLPASVPKTLPGRC